MLKTSNRQTTIISIPTGHRISSNYYPFGSTLPTRSWNDASRAYRYGFNSKEKDFETASDAYDFGARIYNGRLGRWMSVDPLYKKHVQYSPFTFCANIVFVFKDPDGKDMTPTIAFLNYLGALFDIIKDNYILQNIVNQIKVDIVYDAYFFPRLHKRKTESQARAIKSSNTIEVNLKFFSSSTDPTILIQTILHEMLHILYNNKVLNKINIITDCNGNPTSYYPCEGIILDENKELITILEYMNKYGLESSDGTHRGWQHNYMADFGRGEIIKAMKFQDLDLATGKFKDRSGTYTITDENGNIIETHQYTSSEFYEAMSFAGLEGTDSWNNLDQETKVKYTHIIKENDAKPTTELKGFKVKAKRETK